MSQDWHHPLLWAHYADKHQGLCLGFDVAENGKFSKVEYHEERPTLSEFGCNTFDDFNESHMRKLLFRKFSAWNYETEYRTFSKLEEKDPINGLYFLPFNEDMKLVEVIVGERSTLTRSKLACVLGGSAETVKSIKARAGFQKFEVVENKDKSIWN